MALVESWESANGRDLMDLSVKSITSIGNGGKGHLQTSGTISLCERAALGKYVCGT